LDLIKLVHGEGPSRITLDSNRQIASCGLDSISVVFHNGGLEEDIITISLMWSPLLVLLGTLIVYWTLPATTRGRSIWLLWQPMITLSSPTVIALVMLMMILLLRVSSRQYWLGLPAKLIPSM
uniref:Uncharacterized protein n=1 Tax=Amphimedon queenslandica TaxID=400682 RepID=A0A1X7U1D9_AMPQE